jgi:glucan exporter ATP-binding protein
LVEAPEEAAEGCGARKVGRMNLVRIYLRVLSFLAPNAALAWTLALSNIALATTQFAEPVLFGKVVDTLSGAQVAGSAAVWPRLLTLLAAWVSFGIFNIVCSTLVALYADRLAHCRRHAVLTDYFEHVLQLPLAYHSNKHSGRLMKVMLQGTDSLWGLWVGFFREHMAGFVSFFVLLPLALYMNWRLALLLVALCGVFTVLTIFVVKKSEEGQMQVEEHYSALAERASDTLSNVPLVHSFARVQAEVNELKNVIAKLLAAQLPVLSWWAVIAVLTRAATTITILCIIVVGALLNLNGQATVGEIVTFMNFATMLIDRLQHAVGFVNRLFGETPRLQEFFDVLDTIPSLHDRPGAIDPGRLEGRVAFEKVSFSYDGKHPAVADLDFVAEPGDTIALVGATGAGKSTALALLHRAFDPQSGRIEIDGHDIRDYTLAGLRRNIGVVFQEAMLFNRSIRENLLIGRPDATEAEIRRAAERAQAIEFIERNSEGFDARVGERGRMLSGGERQRLSIARALLKDPPIMILDEATSALDSQTEEKLLIALDEVMKGRTTFVIAHRLSTIRKATRILVFQHGRIIECGTFQELIAASGNFADLARSQFLVTEDKSAPVKVKHAAGAR